MKSITKLLFVVFIAGFSTFAESANITNVWNVSDTGQVNCTDSPHGLWTNQLQLGAVSCSQYYSFDVGSQLIEYDDGTAHLLAAATNPADITASIDIWFGGWVDTYGPTKNGGGSDESDWDFYTQITSGAISIDSTDYFVSIHDAGSDGNADNDYVMQIGTGANDKTPVFGSSVWLDVFDALGNPLYTGGQHWDLNMDLTAAPTVPVPAAFWLFGSGLIAMVGIARRRSV